MSDSNKKENQSNKQQNNLLPFILLICVIIICGTAIYIKNTNGTQQSEISKTEQATQITPEIQTDSPVKSQSFLGILPCADCSGIKTELTLQKNSDDPTEGVYVITESYQGKTTKPITSLGKWNTDRGTPKNPDDIVITLKPGNGDQPQYWLVVDNDTVQLLDSQKNKPSSPTNQILKRVQE